MLQYFNTFEANTSKDFEDVDSYFLKDEEPQIQEEEKTNESFYSMKQEK